LAQANNCSASQTQAFFSQFTKPYNHIPQTVKIIEIEHLTHSVLRIVVEKPEGMTFEPGQATDISIDKEGWKEELRPFTSVAPSP
jgi:ferredoxin-NADP reductase